MKYVSEEFLTHYKRNKKNWLHKWLWSDNCIIQNPLIGKNYSLHVTYQEQILTITSRPIVTFNIWGACWNVHLTQKLLKIKARNYLWKAQRNLLPAFLLTTQEFKVPCVPVILCVPFWNHPRIIPGSSVGIALLTTYLAQEDVPLLLFTRSVWLCGRYCYYRLL